MVSELAGEGAPQLPTPASHVELRYRRRDEQIRRGVNLVKTVTLFTPSTVFGALSLDGNSRSRSVEILSRVLVSHLFAGFNRTSWSRSMRNWSRELVDFLFVAFISWSKSVESMSAELINRSLMAIVVPSSLVLEQWRSWSRSMKISSRVLVNPLFIAFECRSWSRSVEIDDSSSEEIEDKAENDDDGEELTAVNKIRRRRFVFDDEEEQEEDNDEIDVVAAGMSTHIQKLSSAQMKLDLDVLSSSFVVSRASSASLGFSFTGFSKTFSDERADSKAFSDDNENSAVVSRLQSVNFDVVFSTQLPNDCFNSNCKEVSEWARKGCRRRTGEFADLCDPCASAYKERGIECITNAQSDFLPLQPEGIKNSRSWTSCLFNGSVIQTKLQPKTPYGDITGCIDRPHLNERPPVSSLENKRKEEKFGNLLNRSLKSCVLGRLENEHIGFSCSEQTSEHALLAFTLGVRQIICCCNKMGVTANTLRLEDPVENIGAKLVRQVAAKTNGLVGDVLWEMFNDTCKRMRIMKSSLLIEQEKPNERIANYQVLLSLTDCTLSSQVLTVNQVEKILKFLELRDWKASFFEVIPQRKRCEADSEDVHDELEGEENTQEQGDDCQDMKSQCIEGKQLSWCSVSLTFHLKLGIQRFACSAYRGVLEDSTPSVEKNVKGVKVIT